VDLTGSGYSVYTYNFGQVNATSNPVITDGAMPKGTVFSFIVTAPGTQSVILDSPNSQALLVTTGNNSTPEPASFFLIGAGLLGLAMVRRRA
jgi:hypothetical protein